MMRTTATLSGAESWIKTATEEAVKRLSHLSYRHGELDDYLQQMVIQLGHCIRGNRTVLTLYEQGQEVLVASNSCQLQEDKVADSLITPTQVVTMRGEYIATPTPLLVSYGAQLPAGYSGFLGVPLRSAHGHVIGALGVFTWRFEMWSTEAVDIAMLFADRSAAAIENYLLHLAAARL